MDVIRDAVEPAEWRKEQGLTLQSLAIHLKLAGRNPARQLQRYETGAQQAPAEIVQSYFDFSEGAVTPCSFHKVRLAFLREQEAVGS